MDHLLGAFDRQVGGGLVGEAAPIPWPAHSCQGCWAAALGRSFHLSWLCAADSAPPWIHRRPSLQLSEYTASHFARSGIDLQLGTM